MRRRLKEASEFDIILSTMDELTHSYDDNGREVPSYFNLDEITTNYGLTIEEVIDIAENNGYNVYRIPGGDDLVNKLIIAHHDLSYGDIVKEDTTKVDINEIGRETDDSFNMEEDYMDDVKPFNKKQVFDELKRETNNFTKEDKFCYSFESEWEMATSILMKHYDDVDFWTDNRKWGTGLDYFVEFKGPKKGGKKKVQEERESQEYKGYKIVFHPGYNMWTNMKDYYIIYNPKGAKVGGMKTLEAAKKLVDSRIANKEDEYKVYLGDDLEEDTNTTYVWRKTKDIGSDWFLVKKGEKDIANNFVIRITKPNNWPGWNPRTTKVFTKNGEILVSDKEKEKVLPYSLDGIKRYFIDNLGKYVEESLAEDIEINEGKFSNNSKGSCYITSDGRFYNLETYETHEEVDYEDLPIANEGDQTIMFNDTRTEQGMYPYCYIELKPTEAQYNSLAYAIDNLPRSKKTFEVNLKNKKIKEYDLTKVISDDIIKDIRNYFNKKEIEEDIEKHDTLNPKLFDGEELKPEIKDKIEQIAYQFIRELNEDGIRFTLKDIVLLGSNVSYNYTKDSDLDIHLIADSEGLECPDDLYPLLYSAYRSMFNKNYDIRIKGIPSEIYVEMDEPQAKSNGIYSLNNGWLKKPEQKAIPDLDKEAFDKLFKEWEERYNKLIGGIANVD